MIEGTVNELGVPVIELKLAGRSWIATIDTGFNGGLELPEELRPLVNPIPAGRATSMLAGGQMITENQYRVTFPFDGKLVKTAATFVAGDGILIGTRLLKPYRLTVDFPERKMWLERE